MISQYWYVDVHGLLTYVDDIPADTYRIETRVSELESPWEDSTWTEIHVGPDTYILHQGHVPIDILEFQEDYKELKQLREATKL